MELSSQTEHNPPLYQLIFEHMLKRLEQGEWQAHDKLPSIRHLAVELEVHRLTVFRAYKMLCETGKVYVKDKSGYYVSHISPVTSVSPVKILTELPSQMANLPNTNFTINCMATSNLPTHSFSEIQRIPATYQFSQALIDPGLLPNLYLSDYVKKVFDLYPKLMGTYASVQGDEELRVMLSQHFHEQMGIQLTAEEMLITSGAQQAIHLLAEMLVGPMDAVLIERPTYSIAMDVFKSRGARLLPVDITEEGYDLEQLEALIHKYKPRLFYMNPTHQNPTGYTVPSWQRKQLVELAERYNCLLIEDDAFHDIYFAEEPPLPLFTYDTFGKVVYIRSFSKYVAPGLRICAVACRKPLIDSLVSAKSLVDNGTPLLNQKIFLHYYTSPRLQQHVGKLRIALQIHKEIVEKKFAAAGWQWTSPQGGLNLWAKLPDGITAQDLLQVAVGQSISFMPGPLFDHLGKFESWVRLSYSFTNETVLREGVEKLIRLVERLGDEGDSFISFH
ncbi:PLP-dependent aminotransferase family protein [Paenibacillus turicensis]|uniref:aminotransferase-like domain-containing protein n=1 Tax=Paenibacillus turicensis TaxID=160487 RepID=UPI003D2A3FC8